MAISKHEPILAAGRLQVRFSFRDDRLAHEILVANGDAWVAVLFSVEGTPEEAWPPSPPLQSLHVEQRPEGPVGLLVGMAGKSHWSASVQMDSSSEQARFELAARIRDTQATSLHSTYRLADRCTAEPISRGVRIVLDSKQSLLAALELSAADKTGEIHWNAAEQILRLVPASKFAAAGPSTVCWGYRVTVLNSIRPA